MLLRDVTKRIPVAEAVVVEEGEGAVTVMIVQGIMVVRQVTDMVDPGVVVLGRAWVKVQAVAPPSALVLGPNHHDGVPVFALAPLPHLDSRMKLFAS
jgi:hypothetical protein